MLDHFEVTQLENLWAKVEAKRRKKRLYLVLSAALFVAILSAFVGYLASHAGTGAKAAQNTQPPGGQMAVRGQKSSADASSTAVGGAAADAAGGGAAAENSAASLARLKQINAAANQNVVQKLLEQEAAQKQATSASATNSASTEVPANSASAASAANSASAGNSANSASDLVLNLQPAERKNPPAATAAKLISTIDQARVLNAASKPSASVLPAAESQQKPAKFEQNPEENKPNNLLQIRSSEQNGSTNDKISYLKQQFARSNSIYFAIDIAEAYLAQKDAKNAATWALKANQLNNSNERSWLIFAQAKALGGESGEAIRVLKSYLLKAPDSAAAKDLLKKLTNG